MKNVTLAIDEKLLAEARRYAVEHDTTVNALIRGYLEGLTRGQERARLAMQELREMSDRSKAAVRPIEWTRDDLHQR